MVAAVEIPLFQGMNQRFPITLGLVEYLLTVFYRNVSEGGWTLTIADSDGNTIVDGIPLVTGADLLEQYRHLGFAGSMYVATDGDRDAVPTWDTLGATSHFYWVPDA